MPRGAGPAATLLLLSLTAVGCASALRKNVSLDELLQRAGDPGSVAGDAQALFEAAEASFATAELAGVRRAIGEWLASYRADATRPHALGEAAKAWGWVRVRRQKMRASRMGRT